jgi:hypothetical protein
VICGISQGHGISPSRGAHSHQGTCQVRVARQNAQIAAKSFMNAAHLHLHEASSC